MIIFDFSDGNDNQPEKPSRLADGKISVIKGKTGATGLADQLHKGKLVIQRLTLRLLDGDDFIRSSKSINGCNEPGDKQEMEKVK